MVYEPRLKKFLGLFKRKCDWCEQYKMKITSLELHVQRMNNNELNKKIVRLNDSMRFYHDQNIKQAEKIKMLEERLKNNVSVL